MADRVLVGRYRIVRHLARGGMAEVYLGHDQLLDRPVAIKSLLPELARDSDFVERFRREARSAAALNHMNIVSVYDFGEDEGTYFIVMEYVDGVTLREIIRSEAPMEPARSLAIAADVAAALAVAHGHGIIHRDVKPANVLIAASVVKVADFGIARAGDGREGLTMPGAVIGTATYLSPEQAQGLATDERSDLYSLGMVLYEMLAGSPPFSGGNPVAVGFKQLSEIPDPPSSHNPAVASDVDAVVAKVLSSDPDARQRTAEELRADLLSVMPHQVQPEPTVAALPGATAPVAGTAGPANAPTAMLEPVAALAGAGAGPGGGGGPPVDPRRAHGASPAGYRRRRMAALGLVALVLVAAVAVVAAVEVGGRSGRGTTVVGSTTTAPPIVPLSTTASTTFRTATSATPVSRAVNTARPPTTTATTGTSTTSSTLRHTTTAPSTTVVVTTVPVPTSR